MQLDKYVGSVLMGDQFNEVLDNIPLIKFMNNDDKHYKMQYTDGLNHDILPFDSMRSFSPGGIYITTIEYWFKHINAQKYYAREVIIPNDAYVYVESLDRIKCSQVFLKKKKEKTQLIKKLFDRYIRYSANIQGIVFKNLNLCIYSIYYIDPKYIDSCTLIKIIKTNSFFLEMIDPMYWTQELLLEATKQNGLSLKFIPRNLRSFEMLLNAVKQNGLSLEYIDPCDQNYRLHVEAVKQTGHAIKFIEQKSRTSEIIRHALKTPNTLGYLGKYGNYD